MAVWAAKQNMNVRKLSIISALALTSCDGSQKTNFPLTENTQPSITLDAKSGFVKIANNWTERADDIYGPSKLLAYMTFNKRATSGILLFSCEGGHTVAMVQIDSGTNPINYEAEAIVRLGKNPPKSMLFVAKAGDNALRAGDGSPKSAEAFLQEVVDVDEVAIKLETVLGSPSGDPPLVFDTTGVKNVQRNLNIACASQSIK